MPQPDPMNWPTGGGKMGERIRTANWPATSLGPIQTWPHALKDAIDILLRLPMAAALAWSEDGIMIYNDACAAYAETLRPAPLGCKLEECWPDNEEFRNKVRKVRQDGLPIASSNQEMTLRYDDQARRIWLSVNYSPVPGESGNPAGVLVLFIDDTEPVQAEQALRESEQCLSVIFARAQVGLSVISARGRFLRVNDELCRMLGQSRNALLKLRVQDVTHPDDLDNTLQAVRRLLTTGEPVSIDKHYLRPDGTQMFSNSIISRLESRSGQPSVLAVTVDLTERKRVQDALAESEAKFRALAEASPALIWQLDPRGFAVYINPRCHTLLGVAEEALLGFGWKSFIHPEDFSEWMAQLDEALRDMKPTQRRLRVKAADGQWHWMESHAAPLFIAGGKYAGHVGTTIDVNDAARAQEELQVSNERLNLALEGSGDGVWDWNMQTDEIVCSQRAKEILGVEKHEGPIRYKDWEKHVHPQDLSAVLTELRDCTEGKKHYLNMEFRIRYRNESWRWILKRAIVVKRDAGNKAQRMTGTITDISEKRRSDEVVWHHANFDALTGLPNRRLFRDRLDHEVRKAQRTGLPLALLFIDLDRFKETNDVLGHDVGDKVLIEAGRRIRVCVRQSDTVARLGGDEFTAILTELDGLVHVEPVARKVNEALATPYRIGNEVIHLSASIGITLYPSDAATAEDLIRNADQAMYVAKNSGRNQFSYFTPSMQREAQERSRLIDELRYALGRDQLKVYFQPMVELATGRIVKAEALLRWRHPRLGMLEPLRFIPFAEESGLIVEIGDWVFRQAAACSRKWGARLGKPFQISVNQSPVQFHSRTDEEDWPAYLRRLGLTGGSVSVEVTENLLINASPAVAGKLLRYRDAGIQVALDNFGTGYSSMSHLKQFDIDYLKIAPSFIHSMVTDANDRAIVRSVTAMAHELGLQVIAEGIETAEQQALLLGVQCDFGQGFLYAQAAPADEFERLLSM